MSALLFASLVALLPLPVAAEEPAAPAPAADAAAVREPVEKLYAALPDVMKRAEELGFEGRYRILEPVIGASYDVPFMAELILGRQWGALPEQKSPAPVTVSTTPIASTASGELEVGAAERGNSGTSVVRRSWRSDDDPVSLDYRMRLTFFIDVLRHGEHGAAPLGVPALMRRDGFDALIGWRERRSPPPRQAPPRRRSPRARAAAATSSSPRPAPASPPGPRTSASRCIR
jgi:phospholipid transport system substrate-binding protein